MHISCLSYKLHKGSAQMYLDTDHEGSFKCNQPTTHQYAADTAAISQLWQQTGGEGGGIY